MDLFEFDRQQQITPLCGVDEAGRGPLAGDVYAAAVILPANCQLEGLNDSKKLTAKRRDCLYDAIIKQAVSYHIGIATLEEIEQYNILQATYLAMQRAVIGLTIPPVLILVDGTGAPSFSTIHTRCIVKGDQQSASIAAASILAKVSRDRYMLRMAEQYPLYSFEKHKGYGTKLHYQELDAHGISPLHRQSFLKKYQQQKQSSMASHLTTGKQGESLACDYLETQGYQIIARNYHTKHGEIDIIAKKGVILSFVEVKTRTQGGMYAAQDAVTKKKRQGIKQTASCYLMDASSSLLDSLQPRFDVCEVYVHAQHEPVIEWIENAFS